MSWLKKILGNGAAAPAEPEQPAAALQDLSLDVLVSENLRLGAEIDSLRQRRMAIKALIDQKIREREMNAPRGSGSANINAG